MDECSEWLAICLQVFPSLRSQKIECGYSKMSRTKLGQVSCKIKRHSFIDSAALLLRGEVKSKVQSEIDSQAKIKINNTFQRIDNEELRKLAVQSIIMHELLHLELKDILTLSQNYRRRKKKRIHTKDFKQEVLNRFNELRKLNNYPLINSADDLDLAVNSLVRKHF